MVDWQKILMLNLISSWNLCKRFSSISKPEFRLSWLKLCSGEVVLCVKPFVLQKIVLKKFEKSKEKHLCWSLFLIKLQFWRSKTLLKRESNTDVFLRTQWILPIAEIPNSEHAMNSWQSVKSQMWQSFLNYLSIADTSQ